MNEQDYNNIGQTQNTGSTTQQGMYQQGMGYQQAVPYQQPVSSPKVKKEHKTHPVRRFVAVCMSAVLFGVLAGGTMYGVNYAGIRLFGSGNEQSQASGMEESAGEIAENAAQTSQTIASTADGVIDYADQEISASVIDVSDVVKKCMPSAVSIVNTYTTTVNYYGQRYEQTGQAGGTGIIIGQSDTELLLVTNYHVVADTDELMITFIDETTAQAYIKGYDENVDIAVIAIPLTSLTNDTLNAIAIAVLGDSDALEVGEPAIVIGNAMGYGQSVTSGVISALNRELVIDNVTRTLIQTDAAINPGNSGGALLNMQGEVVGISSNKIGATTVEGMCYAIPISLVKDLIEELSLKETLVKVEEGSEGYMGIYGQNVTTDVNEMYDIPIGVYISSVIEGEAAEACGLQRGDVITAINGTTITTMDELTSLLEYYAAGTTIELTVQSKETGAYVEKTVQLTLGQRAATETVS